jgi:hypothetical protein
VGERRVECATSLRNGDELRFGVIELSYWSVERGGTTFTEIDDGGAVVPLKGDEK